VKGLEDQLREAYREAADTVRPHAIGDLDLDPGWRAEDTSRAARRRRRGRVLMPVAAAASVAAVVAATAVVVPWLDRGAPAHEGRARHAPVVASGLAALPQYTVLNNGNNLEVVVTATGAVAGRLSAPIGQAFAAITGTAGNRTFLAAADLNPQTSCQALFYQFSLSADGQPSALTRLPVRPLPALPTALATSADGSQLAYSVTKCASGASGQTGSGQPSASIGLINLATGRITRQWSYTLGEDYTTDLSMSADGSLLGYSNFMNASLRVGRVLAASTPSGPDQGSSRIVIRNPNMTALSTSGSLMYAITGARDQILAAYATASGQQVKVLYRWPAAAQPGPLVIDPAGGYALLPVTATPARRTLSPFIKGRHCLAVTVHNTLMCQQTTPLHTRFISVNLATGTLTTLPFSQTGPVGWGMVAW